jgi:hypothetical protein
MISQQRSGSNSRNMPQTLTSTQSVDALYAHKHQISQDTALHSTSQTNFDKMDYFGTQRNSGSICNRSQDSSSTTNLNIKRASSADGSLERIHTFNLKQ